MFGPKDILDTMESFLFGAPQKAAEAKREGEIKTAKEVVGAYHGVGDGGFVTGARTVRE